MPCDDSDLMRKKYTTNQPLESAANSSAHDRVRRSYTFSGGAASSGDAAGDDTSGGIRSNRLNTMRGVFKDSMRVLMMAPKIPAMRLMTSTYREVPSFIGKQHSVHKYAKR